MRYLVVTTNSEGGGNVAVVMHDHVSGVVICRSLSESFLRIFDAFATKHDVKLLRVFKSIQVTAYGIRNYDWVDSVVTKVVDAVDPWVLGEQGIVQGQSVEDVVQKYLGGSV